MDFLGRVQDATSNNIGDRIRDKTVRRMKNILHKRTERETFLSFHSSNKLLTEIGEESLSDFDVSATRSRVVVCTS